MLGGSIGSSTGSENTGWSISVPARFTAAALRLLADVVQQPKFEASALETERALALAELAMLRDDMSRYPLRLVAQSAFGDHPYGAGVLGSDTSLRAITNPEVRAWHAAHVLRGPTVIGIVCGEEPDMVARDVIAMFDVLRPGVASKIAAPVWPDRPVARAELGDAKAPPNGSWRWRSPGRRDEIDDRMAAELIGTVASGLGGRFFDELRDRQSLAYTVRAFALEWTLAGMFIGYIATSPSKEAVARAGLLAEFAKLCESGVSAEELAEAQDLPRWGPTRSRRQEWSRGARGNDRRVGYLARDSKSWRPTSAGSAP